MSAVVRTSTAEQVSLIAAFLKDRDESVLPGEATHEERMESAAAILWLIFGVEAFSPVHPQEG